VLLNRFLLVLLLTSQVLPALSTASPVCPSDNTAANPPYAAPGQPPSVAIWKGLSNLPKDCHATLTDGAELSVALSSLFVHTGSIEDLATRLGAVSSAKGLHYWSVTDQGWRNLVSESHALSANNTRSTRSDFTAQEILSGKTLYFSQNDTRSWGNNTYTLQVISSSQDHLTLQSSNASAVRLGPIAIFAPGDTQTVLFIDRLKKNTWRYFSLAVIRKSTLPLREKSVVNRQAAFYRHLLGQDSKGTPPLAP